MADNSDVQGDTVGQGAQSEVKSKQDDELVKHGLGFGVDGSDPTRKLPILVLPVRKSSLEKNENPPVYVTELSAEIGLKSFSKKMHTNSHLRKKLIASVESQIPGPNPINFDLSLQLKKSSLASEEKRVVGSKILTREYCFQIFSPAMKTTGSKTVIEELIDSSLKDKQEKSDRIAPASDKTELFKACQGIIENDLQGATHFVSAIQMGAKIYKEIVMKSSYNVESSEVNVGASVSNAVEAKVSFSKEFINEAAKCDSAVKVTAGSSYLKRLLESKSENFDQFPNKEEEVVISKQILPISALIRDRDRREAMNKACRCYLDRELSHGPPLLTRPLFLKVGRETYLALNKCSLLCITRKREKATPIYLEPATTAKRNCCRKSISVDWKNDTNVPFYIAFARNKRKYYLGLSSDPPENLFPDQRQSAALQPCNLAENCNPDAGSQHNSPRSQSQNKKDPESKPFKQCEGWLKLYDLPQTSKQCWFYLHYPGSGDPSKTLSSWAQEGHLCVHKRSRFFKKSVLTLIIQLSRKKRKEGARRGAKDGTNKYAEEGAEEDAKKGTKEDAMKGAEKDAKKGAEEDAETGAEEDAEGGAKKGATKSTKGGGRWPDLEPILAYFVSRSFSQEILSIDVCDSDGQKQNHTSFCYFHIENVTQEEMEAAGITASDQ